MNLEHVRCDLCGSDDYRVRYRKPDNWLWLSLNEYPIVKCIGCGLVYVNPRLTFQEMRNFYPPGHHFGRDNPPHLQRYSSQFDYIVSFSSRRVLDVDCARGDWLAYVGGRWPDAELFGVDASSEGATHASIDFKKGALLDLYFHGDFFDLITSWAVFEHVHMPDTYFETIARIIAPGRKFVCLVTNAESIYGRYAYQEDVPRHLYHFSEHRLGQYAIKHGLRLDAVFHESRFWDGTGRGAFRYAIARLFRIWWRDIRASVPFFWQKAALRFDSALDTMIFCCAWETLIRRSGIIVATMSRD